jgi:xanthosine utilization system XapX-like protein
MTVCGNWTANTLMVSLGYTSANITVPEPLYSVWVGVIGIYFGQQLKK